MDVDAFDLFAEECGLRIQDARALWNALGE